MTIASHPSLPSGFQSTEYTPLEWEAVQSFFHEAATSVPDARLLGARRTSSGHLKIMLEIEAAEHWDVLDSLARIANAVHRDTGVFLNLD